MKTKQKDDGAKKRPPVPEWPTLEQLLWAVDDGNPSKVFVDPVFDDEGRCVKRFTPKGEELYARLVGVVGGAIRLALYGEHDDDYIAEEINEIVENLDQISEMPEERSASGENAPGRSA